MRYFIVFSLLSVSAYAWSEDTGSVKTCNGKYGAEVVSVQGKLFSNLKAKNDWQEVRLNDVICEGSRVKVENNSRATLTLSNGITLRLDKDTIISLQQVQPDSPVWLKQFKGFLHTISRTPKRLTIETPIANAGPEGTEFAMNVNDNKASLWVYEGGVKFFNDKGEVKLKPGESAQAQLGQAPKAKIDLKPKDAVNWALYYPPVLPYSDANAAIDNDLRQTIQDYRQGKVDVALKRLDNIPINKQTPYFRKVRAAIRLTTGQDELALQDIQALLTHNPNDADALALKSIRALTQNRKDEACDLAVKATKASPQSASAYSALSYAEQGRFNLEKAQAAADQAVKLAPNDALVWARKAELELSQGLIKESQKSAQKAAELDANLERTQTVMGFAHLLRMDTDEALQSFDKAIQLDSTSPLARLGLGLAKIRDGDLAEGRQDLEIAATLDPNNSIVRSYLGKAYYEERRSKLADDQFGLAKERDPKDPTSYFYDAINKQTTNRPVEALRDMQKAIELNDNRGVYRSSLAMDKDLAARSAAQGRIYNELGFQQQGLLEGWKSVNRDHTNYSAHRLLADNYAALPRHELARVSELLQSQLLQPVNITPIQPNLAESNLFILNGLGPNDLSFNEFNPLFEYNRFAFQTSGLYGSNNTWGDNTNLSGIHDNVSFSLGQFHYETDGFRENNFLKKDLYNAFIQAQLTDDLNLQVEYRHEDRDGGDLSQNFFENVFSPQFNQKNKMDSFRIGGLYILNPNSSIIGSLTYQDLEIQRTGVNIPTIRNNKGYISELQYNFKNSHLNTISGFGHLNHDSTTQLELLGSSPIDLSVIRTNFYNYTKFSIDKQIIATLGLSFDFLQLNNINQNNDNSLEINRVHPKLGIEWMPSSSTTIRGGVFRAMSITRNLNQTIEPTQIAGFNQFYDDLNGSVFWRYGIGIDHKFTNKIATGLEYSERKIDVPREQSNERSEQIARAYAYYTPYDFFSLAGEYYFERIDQADRTMFEDLGLFHLTETHRFPITLSFFHSSGLSLKIKNSFVHQSGLFKSPDSCTFCNESISGNSNFFVVDLNLSYRFPHRYGMLSFGVNNLFNEKFNYQNTTVNSNETFFSPSRVIFSRLTISF